MTRSDDDSRNDGVRDAPAIPAALATIAKERGWPPELTRRVSELQVPISSLYSWAWYGLSPEQTATQLGCYERMTVGDLRARDATYADNEEFSAMWSDSPEEIAGWEIIVERGVPSKNSERGEKSRVLGFAAVVSPAWIRPCVRSFWFLPADCAAGRWWN
jgi:hypothetical protein